MRRAYLGLFGGLADDVQIVNVDHVKATANGQRLVVELLRRAVLRCQLVQQSSVLSTFQTGTVKTYSPMYPNMTSRFPTVINEGWHHGASGSS